MMPALWQFQLMSHAEQAERIARLAAQGWNDNDIARLTGWDVNAVRHTIEQRRFEVKST